MFKDVPVRAYDAISRLQDIEIINGKTTTLFGSNDTITRGEMAIIAFRAYDNFLEAPEKADHSFTDATDRYVTAINRLQASDVTQGKSVTQFGTYDKMTRGEFAVMMFKLDSVLSPSPYCVLPSSQAGVTLKTEKESYSLSDDQGVCVIVENTGPYSFFFDYYQDLEVKKGDTWYVLRYDDDMQFPLVTYETLPYEKSPKAHSL